MEPTKKSNPLEIFFEELTRRTSSIRADHCVAAPFGCGQPIEKFKDEISEKEYRISGLCQECQDKFFD